MSPGGSCNYLRFPHNISYAFNAYFQSNSQKMSENGCDFNGLGMIIPDDPSIDNCSFPVSILSTEFANTNGRWSSNALRHFFERKVTFFSIFLLYIFLY